MNNAKHPKRNRNVDEKNNVKSLSLFKGRATNKNANSLVPRIGALSSMYLSLYGPYSSPGKTLEADVQRTTKITNTKCLLKAKKELPVYHFQKKLTVNEADQDVSPLSDDAVHVYSPVSGCCRSVFV